jgi:hypothetical protein
MWLVNTVVSTQERIRHYTIDDIHCRVQFVEDRYLQKSERSVLQCTTTVALCMQICHFFKLESTLHCHRLAYKTLRKSVGWQYRSVLSTRIMQIRKRGSKKCVCAAAACSHCATPVIGVLICAQTTMPTTAQTTA